MRFARAGANASCASTPAAAAVMRPMAASLTRSSMSLRSCASVCCALRRTASASRAVSSAAAAVLASA